MSKDTSSHKGVPYNGESKAEKALWNHLSDIREDSPSPNIRQGFYQQLNSALKAQRKKTENKPSFLERCRTLFGFQNYIGFVTASCCLVIGLVIGQANFTKEDGDQEITTLQNQVASLHRSFVLDRLQNNSANKRLLGVRDASSLVDNDPEITLALLTTAQTDTVASVRSAAIEVLSTQFDKPEIANQMMAILENSNSPLVQLSIIEVVLRRGNQEQLKHLVKLSDEGLLHAELSQRVNSSIVINEA